MRTWQKGARNETEHETHEYKKFGLYLGLLTHKDSEYSRTPFVELFGKAMELGGANQFEIKTSITEENPFSTLDVKFSDLLLARVYLPILYRRWADYLVGKKTSRAIKNNLRILANLIMYCAHLTRSKFRAKEQRRLSRDLNITSGHIKLLEDFLNSGTPVGLIFEDDASFDPSKELIFTLFDLVRFTQTTPAPNFFIDVSDSYSFQELGVQHLVILPKLDVGQDKFLGSSIRSTEKPFTNTCCAILYNRSMAQLMLARVKSYSRTTGKRVIPIDWMLNSILLELESTDTKVSSFHLDPGIFPQNSLAHLKKK